MKMSESSGRAPESRYGKYCGTVDVSGAAGCKA